MSAESAHRENLLSAIGGVRKAAQLAERDVLLVASREHDETMRMQALAIGTAISPPKTGMVDGKVDGTLARIFAKWAYHEATGREW